jgi:hypothetical protein
MSDQEKTTLFRVTLHSSVLVKADHLPHLHEVLIAYGFGPYGLETVHSAAEVDSSEPNNPAPLPPPDHAPPRDMTLVEQILHHARREGGVHRKDLKAIAQQYGFNVGSISPTLVKLVKGKKIKRIGKGIYATRNWRIVRKGKK